MKLLGIKVLVLVSIASKLTAGAPPVVQHVTSPDSAHDYTAFLKANYQQFSGRPNDALQTYQKELLPYSPSPAAYGSYFQLLFDLGQHDILLKLFEEREADFTAAFRDDISTRICIAHSYLSSHQEAQAEKHFLALAEKHPDNEHVAYFATMAYMHTKQLDKAAQFIDACLKKPSLKQKHFLFNFLRSKVYVEQNNLPAALECIEKSLTQYPGFDRGHLFKAILHEQMGNVNDAIKGFQHFLGIVGRDDTVEKQLIQLLFSQKRYAEARTYLKRIKSQTPEYFFDLALIELKAKHHAESATYIDRALALDPCFVKAIMLKMELLLSEKKQHELTSFITTTLTKMGHNPQVVHACLLARNAGIAPELIIKAFEHALGKKPQLLLLAALADLHVDTRNFKQAVATYQRIIAASTDKVIQAKAQYQICYIHFLNHESDALEKAITTILASGNVDHAVYNLIAYHYASEDKRMEEALKYCDMALQLDPERPQYLDTKAYILGKLGNEMEALDLIQRAFQLAPHDKIIQQRLLLIQQRVAAQQQEPA